MPYYENFDQLMQDRVKWLTVRVDQNDAGTYDVVLTIDGSYGEEADAETVAAMFRDEFSSLLQRQGIQRS